MDRRLTTIVAADLVGYSRLMAADEEGTLRRFRAVRSELIMPELEAAGARLIKTMGDGLLVEFPSPVAAVRASLAIQQSMVKREHDQSDAKRLQFRIGINLGDVIIDGDDILGDGVNVAARLESLAPPGGICISRAVHEQLRGKIDTELTSLGPQSVKNIPEPIEVWRAEVEGVAEEKEVQTRPAEPPSIVILPFDNMSSDPDQEFLADGIVEDVTTELSKFRTLFVIARTSAFSYKNTHQDIRDIARELGVRYVVEGSVRRAGDRLRVTAQLIEAESGVHVWAERWDRTMEDLFDLQDELTHAIVTAVEPELGAHERMVLRRKPTRNMTAWELCQKGFAEYLTFSETGYATSYDLYHQAIKADPNFALPEAHLGRWHWMMIISGRSTDLTTDLRLGIDHSRRSIALDDRLDMGFIALGVLLAMAGREDESENAFRIAEGLNSNNVRLHHARGLACIFQKDPDCDLIQASALSALKLSPKDPMVWGFHQLLCNSYLFRDFDLKNPKTRKHIEIACQYEQADYSSFLIAALVNVAIGKRDEAARYLRRCLEKNPGLTLAGLRTAFHFPIWPKMFAIAENAYEQLVDLGLPRE